LISRILTNEPDPALGVNPALYPPITILGPK
jgi:hypothetical protein